MTWKLGKCSGDIRYDAGYVAVWDPVQWLGILTGEERGSVLPEAAVRELAAARRGGGGGGGVAKKKARGRPRKAVEYIDRIAVDVQQHYPAGAREPQLTEDIWHLLGCNASDEDWDRLRECWLDAHDPRDRRKYELEFDDRLNRAASKHQKPDWDPNDVFTRYDAETLHECLIRQGLTYSYDQRGQRVAWRSTNGFNIEATGNEIMCALIEKISLSYAISTGGRTPKPLRFQKEHFRQFMTANIHNRDRRHDPFILFLEREVGTADSSDTIDGLFQVLWDARVENDVDGKLLRHASRAVWLGAVQRAYEPGCVLDESVVLMGGKRFGKSSFIKQMFPDDRQMQWVNDQFDIMMEPREKREATNGRVVLELGEMQGVGRLWQKQKVWLTATADTAREAYADEANTIPRRFICIGTADRREVLPRDSAGIRRFIVVELVNPCPVWELMPGLRMQCWAEAKWLYEQGERANLPPALMGLQLKQNESFVVRDDHFDEAVSKLHDGQVYTVTGLLRDMDLRPTRQNTRSMKSALAMAGFVYGKFTSPQGRRVQGYRRGKGKQKELGEGSLSI